MKHIVLCSDGTGNTAVKGRGTNVWKLYEALDLTGHAQGRDVPRQIAFYDDGVGTQSWSPLRVLSAATGVGLKTNVLQLYRSLCVSYRPHDRISMFGFSRGAYTVRTLAGLVTTCGVVDVAAVASRRELDAMIHRAYAALRARFVDPDDTAAATFRRDRRVHRHDDYAPDGRMRVELVGVWDTVDAYGFPVDEIAQLWNAAVYPFWFPERTLPAMVRRGCQALAIDDERRAFHPVLWEADAIGEGGARTYRERAEQVWFAGVHSNVGGGYPKQGMSLVALDWMMDRAEAAGLRFLEHLREHYRTTANVNDKLYDSRAGLRALYAYAPRQIERICERSHVTPRIHESVLDRLRLATDDYAPGNLPASALLEDGSRRASLVAADARVRRRVEWREVLQAWTAALSVTLPLIAVVLAVSWWAGGARPPLVWLRESAAPSIVTALAALLLIGWSGARGLGASVFGERQERARYTRGRVWLGLAPTLAASVSSAVFLGSWLSSLETDWFVGTYLAALALLAATASASGLARRRIRRANVEAWLRWRRAPSAQSS